MSSKHDSPELCLHVNAAAHRYLDFLHSIILAQSCILAFQSNWFDVLAIFLCLRFLGILVGCVGEFDINATGNRVLFVLIQCIYFSVGGFVMTTAEQCVQRYNPNNMKCQVPRVLKFRFSQDVSVSR